MPRLFNRKALSCIAVVAETEVDEVQNAWRAAGTVKGIEAGTCARVATHATHTTHT